MSHGLTLGLIAAGVLFVAIVFVAATRHDGPSRAAGVVWMRPLGEDIAHAIPNAELRSELADVQALAFCDRWPVDELVRDKRAERCRACVQAVERMEHRRSQ